jgi:LacI family transcriptional regulator
MAEKKIQKKITIKHIAEVAGVSFSTVGKALRGEPVVHPRTRDKILKIAEDLNYYPNIHARSLKTKKTKLIGIILNDLKNPFFSNIYKVIADILNKWDYTMLLCDSDYNLDLERKNIITMLSKGADGIIISPVNEKSDNIRLVIESDLKAVFIDSIPEYSDVNYVFVNHERAGFLSTEYLIEKGHTNILLLNGPKDFSPSKHFLKGHENALTHHNIEPNKKLQIFSDVSIEHGYQVVKEKFKVMKSVNSNTFTAVLTLSDLLALGVYEAALDLEFKIPDDCSVIGYDNIFAGKYVCPPLTTVHQPKIRIGEMSVSILLEKIDNKTEECEKIILEPHLIERSSVKNIS